MLKYKPIRVSEEDEEDEVTNIIYAYRYIICIKLLLYI